MCHLFRRPVTVSGKKSLRVHRIRHITSVRYHLFMGSAVFLFSFSNIILEVSPSERPSLSNMTHSNVTLAMVAPNPPVPKPSSTTSSPPSSEPMVIKGTTSFSSDNSSLVSSATNGSSTYLHSSIYNYSSNNLSIQCIPSSINDFPSDGLTRSQRRSGFILIHVLAVIYLCVMLAIVCDEYFVPSLEQITKVFNIHHDVAGSTFMAVGTSSPELFSSIIGSFISESDIGIGTIVGSAVFNLLAVVAVAGVAVWSKRVELDWYPICRDCSFYALTVSTLVIVIHDGTVSWPESVSLIILYLFYILIMYFNEKIERFSHKYIASFTRKIIHHGLDHKNKQLSTGYLNETSSVSSNKSNIRDGIAVISAEMLNGYENLANGATGSVKINGFTSPDPSLKGTQLPEVDIELQPRSPINFSIRVNDDNPTKKSSVPDMNQRNETSNSLVSQTPAYMTEGTEDSQYCAGDEPQSSITDNDETPGHILRTFPKKSSYLYIVYWILTWPARGLFFISIPFKKSLFMLTFAISCAYIAFLTYFCVWGVTIIGDTLDIPDTVAGLTLLAAGTSIPELISCVIVARSGYANMAVSNAVGSNIFDILFCLGMPWLIKSAFFSVSGVVTIQSGALVYTAITLLTSIIFLLGTLRLANWTLDWRVGVKCSLLYFTFVVLACLYELNVFGSFNLPQCPH